MVVAAILGVVNDVTPVPPVSTLPPEVAAYQSMVAPVLAVAASTTVPVPHLEPSVVDATVGTSFTVAVTAVLVADKHPVVEFLACA